MNTQPTKSRNPMGTTMIVIALLAVLGAMWMLGEAMAANHAVIERRVDGLTISVDVVARELRKTRESCELDREAIRILAERIGPPTPPAPAESSGEKPPSN